MSMWIAIEWATGCGQMMVAPREININRLPDQSRIGSMKD